MSTYSSSEVSQLPLNNLIDLCSQETSRYFSQGEPDTRYCYELFRRALVERVQHAWDAIYTEYQALVSSWVRENSYFAKVGEGVETFVNCAFTAMWRRLSQPDTFQKFPRLDAILTYLKACARSCVRDEYRKYARQVNDTELEHIRNHPTTGNIEETVIRQEQRHILLAHLQAQLKDDQERHVYIYCFEWGLKPSKVYEMYPDLFWDVQEIYRCKRNLLDRLSRDPKLQTLWETSDIS